MRTYVRMGPRPWNPRAELAAALDRGNLRFAVTLAEEARVEGGRPIRLEVALRFLPLIATESPGEYDAWALRWLGRWCLESPAASINEAAEVGAALADLPTEPTAINAIHTPG